MSDDHRLRHALTVTITADAEGVLAELTPTPVETPAELAATWVGRWCRGACRRTSIDTLSWPGHTMQMTIVIDEATHAHLAPLGDPADIAAAIINGTAADLLASKRRGFLGPS